MIKFISFFSFRIHPVDDEGAILKSAKEFAKKARDARQFTNVNEFQLRCLACQTPLKGQTDAQAHAKSTGHTNFGEV